MKHVACIGWALLCTAIISCVPMDETKEVTVKGFYPQGKVEELELCITPMGGDSAMQTIMMEPADSFFTGILPAEGVDFYGLYGTLDGGQLSVPMYLPRGAEYQLELEISDGIPMVRVNGEMDALSVYNAFVYEHSKTFWMEGPNFSPGQVRPFMERYAVVADSIADAYDVPKAVHSYLKVWAYTSMRSLYTSAPRMLKIKAAEMPFKMEDVLGAPEKVLNVAEAACFPSVTYLILGTLPKSTLSERVEYLYAKYQYPAIRNRVVDALMESYISQFNFSGDVESGKKELEEVILSYNLDRRYAEDFAKRCSSVKGAPFPAHVELYDVNGERVDFSVFKGSYVYVDLWASWCGPCCREVPHLQRLEKELKNPDVKFVSVSIDKNEQAWKDKMEDLEMHGHQLINQDNSIADAYNVQGIPYFLIFDKEGRLYMTNAPRPSHPQLRELLENLK